MNIFKTNDVIIKMDNYKHQIEHFSVGADLLEVVAANQCHAINAPPPKICKIGLVCRECRKVAQHCTRRTSPKPGNIE
jgi:hypothetical protein